MKIAVISDIHGNMEALNAVLTDINEQKADRIFILGDLAMAGPEPVKTLDFIMNLQKESAVVIIQGNTDVMIAKSTPLPPNEIMAGALKYAREIIKDDQKEFLLNLPVNYKEKIGQIEVLLVHGSPRRNDEDILPDFNDEKLMEVLGGAAENLIFCGHTHLPVVYKRGNQMVVNTGSVGRPFTKEPKASYTILDYPDLSTVDYKIIHRSIPYHFEKAAEKLAKQPFEGAEKLAKMLIKATSRYPE